MPVRFAKKEVDEIDPVRLSEPELTEDDRAELGEGVARFNDGRYWDAHESWEKVWQRRPEESRIFFQGIIQLAAALHLFTVKRRFQGGMRNLDKADEKLRLFPPVFLRFDVTALRGVIQAARGEASALGPDQLDRFSVVPRITLR